jgi:flagellar hook-associated protein 2
MATITSLGIGSGLQLESIVEAYINAEAIPQEVRLQEKEERLTLELSGVGSFKSALSSFDDILKKLTENDAFNKQVVSSSNDAIEVTTNGFASNGNFNIDVNQLATGTRLQTETFSASSDTVGTGTLTFGNGTDTFDVTVDSTDDLSTIRDKINAQSENFGVTANIINGGGASGTFLVFDSQVTGAANALTVTSSDPSLDKISTNNTVAQIAQDAQITIDANPDAIPPVLGTTVSSATNEFKNVIEDVTITAKSVTSSDETALLSIAQDTENGKTLIDEFISGYNELINQLTGLAAPKFGRLAFDPNVREVKREMANIAINTVSGLSGSLSSLVDIGLELNSDGELVKSTINFSNGGTGQERLNDALDNNLSDLGELFASPNGIASQLASMVENYTDSDGVLTQREQTLNERVAEIETEYETLETRLRSYEETLRQQFSFLDATVASFNATGDFLTSALASLSPED